MDPFEVLGVRPGATRQEIRRAFGAAARRVHPDVAGETPGATERLARLIEARDTLLGVRVGPRPPVTIYHRRNTVERIAAILGRQVGLLRRHLR